MIMGFAKAEPSYKLGRQDGGLHRSCHRAALCADPVGSNPPYALIPDLILS
jgi:hypothetical protein